VCMYVEVSPSLAYSSLVRYRHPRRKLHEATTGKESLVISTQVNRVLTYDMRECAYISRSMWPVRMVCAERVRERETRLELLHVPSAVAWCCTCSMGL
jgi:hypothetical protein